MEIALESAIPTYSGGLGILAGDTLRAAADLAIPMVGMTLLYRKGYFRQHLDSVGNQSESPEEWLPEAFLERLSQRISLSLEGREIHIGVWRYVIRGFQGHDVPVYFLDTHLHENDSWEQGLTDFLYGGDNYFRLCQEAVLGLGGVKMLEALGYKNIHPYHMNEGHSALLTLALLEERLGGREVVSLTDKDRDLVRRRSVFTTHTPVPAGHDQFSLEVAERVLGQRRIELLRRADCCFEGTLNMTHLALTLSHYVNGVAMRHGEISRTMFPRYPIDSITNGVHPFTWTSKPFCELFDRHIPGWRLDYLYLRHALIIPKDQIAEAHRLSKQQLLLEVGRRTGDKLDPSVMTIGFARRMTGYKRPELLFSDLERLKGLAKRSGPMQILYAGKAHPQDELGKAGIRHVFKSAAELKGTLPVIFLENYDLALAQLLCAGVDLWLNTPQAPEEASGTSGMKAALNGVPSFSVMDGWWIEGHLEGVTGWSIGDHWEEKVRDGEEIVDLYEKLEKVILPMFYQQPANYEAVMRSTIAYNAAFFNAHRMIRQYLTHAYSTSYPGLFKEND